MRRLIDSLVFLWAAVDDPRLKGDTRSAFVDPDNDLLLSTATIWEIGITAPAARARSVACPHPQTASAGADRLW